VERPPGEQHEDPTRGREALRLARRVRRLEETLAQVESIRDTNARLLDRLMTDLDAERRRSRALLLNVLPETIVQRLDAGETLIADAHDHVAVLFSDFVGFTDRAARYSPAELVTELNAVFGDFDAACERHGVEKIKTIGDAYMAAAGLDPSDEDPVAAAALLALDMRDSVAATGGRWQIRIGIDVGPVVAGVIGTRKFAYDVWGDTVNVASRLETTSEAGRIQVSDRAADALNGTFELERRGPTELKGKGPTMTWFLLGRRGVSPASALHAAPERPI
jgi:class 3 adenylate cyclase